MGSDLHMNPPSPPERVLVIGKPSTDFPGVLGIGYYTRQTDRLFGKAETENWSRLSRLEVDEDEVSDVIEFVRGILPGIRVERRPGLTLGEWLPRAALDLDQAKRRRLAELEAEADRLRAELGDQN